jgi:hypothetical protein
LNVRFPKLTRVLVGTAVAAVASFFFTDENKLQADDQKEFIESASCPLKNPRDWQTFLETSADHTSWVETCEDSPCNKVFFDLVSKKINETLHRCNSVILANSRINQCTKNLRTFAPVWLRQHDSVSYGFNVDNDAYLSGQESSDKPQGMMTIPADIVAALPDQQRVQEVARQKGWKYLTHDSALHGTRTFIYVQDPEHKFDQWMLLNLAGPNEHDVAKEMPVSIVGVQKKNAAGEPLKKVRLHFRDYSIEQAASGVRLSVNYEGNGKCYSCHASGMRQLIPRITHVLEAQPVNGEAWFNKTAPPDFASRRLAEFNKIIRRYGANDWDNMIIPEDHGPVLGKAQGCISCHNGETRGALTVSTSIAQLNRKIVTELGMPPSGNLIRYLEQFEMKNPALTDEEETTLRAATVHSKELSLAFMASRLPELKGWLLERSCL